MDNNCITSNVSSTRGTLKKNDLFKLPNILCYIRILMIPLFIYLFCKQMFWQSALVAVLASVTDILDGYIARNFNMKTDWGMFIDPLADKLMQLAMLICSAYKAPLLLLLGIVFLVKELITLAFGLYVYHKGRNLNGSIWCGKLCTVILDISLFYIIGAPEKYIFDGLILGIIGVCSFLLILAFVIYMRKYIELFKLTKQN